MRISVVKMFLILAPIVLTFGVIFAVISADENDWLAADAGIGDLSLATPIPLFAEGPALSVLADGGADDDNHEEYGYIIEGVFIPVRHVPNEPAAHSRLIALLHYARNRYYFWEAPSLNIRTGRFDTDFAQLREAIDNAQAIISNPTSDANSFRAAEAILSDAIAATRATLIDPYNRYGPYLDIISAGEDNPQKRHLRGVWLSTVINIDWPSVSARGTTPYHVDRQQAELRTRFDEIAGSGFNAVIFQISPTADAMFHSQISPWSAWLTGETNFTGELLNSAGEAFDPLQYAIDLARARNIELHAWLNPYRITHGINSYTRGITLSSTGQTVSNLSEIRNEWRDIPGSAFYLFDEYIKWGDNRWYVLDPGVPAARQWIVERVIEIVRNYDVDAIHFDDYFYPANFCIENTFSRYNTVENNRITGIVHPNTPQGRANWKRENTEMLIRDVREAIQAEAPWVKFGVSPGGVWKSAGGNTGLDGGGYNAGTGSLSTTSWSNYHSSHADTRRWIIENLIDYLVPQIYWDWSLTAAPYGAIADWWGRLFHDFGPNGHLRNSQGEYTSAQLFIGTGIYRMEGSPAVKWRNAPGYGMEGKRTFLRQEHYNIGNPNINGSMTFTQNQTRYGRENGLHETMQALQNTAWRYPALVPAMPHLGGTAPSHPANVSIYGNYLIWDNTEISESELVRPRYFVIYRSDTSAINLEDPRNIAAIVPAVNGQIRYYWPLPMGYHDYFFVVTAVNRLHDESSPW